MTYSNWLLHFCERNLTNHYLCFSQYILTKIIYWCIHKLLPDKLIKEPYHWHVPLALPNPSSVQVLMMMSLWQWHQHLSQLLVHYHRLFLPPPQLIFQHFSLFYSKRLSVTVFFWYLTSDWQLVKFHNLLLGTWESKNNQSF